MRRLFERARRRRVDFCVRCAQVCDAGCRRAASSERALLHPLRLGMRI